ncbi:MAG TPA: S8 family serine peptidase, partial [Gemmatimonadales bacterium]|nr:S8 family serine peptidase [Gemmatimonadales bacterium]
GVATAHLTLGREPGTQSASASGAGLSGSPVTFSAQATPNGTITGSVSTTTGFLAPPLRAARVAVTPLRTAARLLALPPRPLPFVLQPLARAAPSLPQRRSPPAYTSNELVVIMRDRALGVPSVGSMMLAGPATARAVGETMRAHLRTVTPAGAELAGVSPTILAARIRVADSTTRDAVAAGLRADPAIATVTRNGLVWLDGAERAVALAGTTVPNDLFYPQQSWHYGLIDLPRAWAITTGSSAVIVAVVDNGIRFDHPDLTANLTTDGYDFVNGVDSLRLCAGGKISNDDDGDKGYDPDPTNPASYHQDTVHGRYVPDSVAGHGVHVAGTIGAVGNDGGGVTGINWTVKIRPVRVLGVGGFGTTYDIAQGILYAAGLPADNGTGGTVNPTPAARIINLSLGGGGDTTLHSAIIAAANAGVLVVAAAGNSSTSTPSYPAGYPEVLAVSAVGPSATLASYSNYGSDIAVAAPGGDFSLGDGSDGIASTLWNFATTAPAYGYYEGTSMASPHVSGVAALILAQNPVLTAANVRSRLTTYAVNIGSATYYGAGLVNAYNSLTQSFGPPTQLYARLYNATTGAIVQTVPTQAGGAYTFTGVADGAFDVYAGTDESGDQQLGIPGRMWGAWGGSALPSAVNVAGAGTYPASFSIGLPTELDPNNALTSANVLMVGGYVHGKIQTASTTVPDDYYRVVIPQAGTYTFETSGWVGACGFALEERTVLGLYDANGTLLSSNDAIDATHFNYCSRITASLAAGTYYVGVAGSYGRRYRLQARSGT